MGSLYDNSGEDIYARRDIEKRRKHAMAMKKKRKRQILKRKIMLFTGAAAILVASLGLTAAVRKNNTASGSSLNPKETQQAGYYRKEIKINGSIFERYVIRFIIDGQPAGEKIWSE